MRINIREMVTGTRGNNSNPQFVSGDTVTPETEPQEVVEVEESSEEDSENK